VLDSIDPDPGRILDAVGRALDDYRAGKKPLDDGGVMTLLASPAQREALEQISGLMSLLEGHGDVTMDRAGLGLVPSADRFGRVLRERRQQARPLARFLQRLIGLEAKLNQYAMGERFIEQVEAAPGEIFDLVWDRPENLPTLTEIRDPDLWIARVQPARVG
jgi:putative hydrolase